MRVKFSVLLVSLGLILAFLPEKNNHAHQLKPEELLDKALDETGYVTVDQAARFMISEDTTVQFIDLRTPDEYREFTIPGSINIPYNDLFNKDWQGYLNQNKVKNIFYAHGDVMANLAWTLTTSMGYEHNYVMKGGLNEWFNTVMYSQFKGGRITPKENALFETRYNARKLFTQINSLPDSLKLRFIEAKRIAETKLDGGCE